MTDAVADGRDALSPHPVESWRQGALGHVRLCRPEKRNAIDSRMSAEVTAAVERFGGERDCLGIVLSAEGPAFCSGADLSEPSPAVDESWTWSEAPSAVMLAALAACPIPIVVAVEGWAVGMGLAILGSAAYVVSSAEARFWLPEATLGYFPFGVVASLLPRVAAGTVTEWALSARQFGADEALASGLVTSLAPAGSTAAAAAELLARFEPHGRDVVESAMAFLRESHRAAAVSDLLEWCGEQMTAHVRAADHEG
ncbi:enoyl-CoA hydratase/isomerase family protein [Desertimonas flava]|uniref:enoyl-CoA hydratase/isomerase family protein n=1 Tax=Desertimonas flava TaxID=2064846 RepID=UPI000E351F0A|nr:enoyl-CoA hydratase/isomerase family protein [Desertimonas flava]